MIITITTDSSWNTQEASFVNLGHFQRDAKLSSSSEIITYNANESTIFNFEYIIISK